MYSSSVFNSIIEHESLKAEIILCSAGAYFVKGFGCVQNELTKKTSHCRSRAFSSATPTKTDPQQLNKETCGLGFLTHFSLNFSTNVPFRVCLKFPVIKQFSSLKGPLLDFSTLCDKIFSQFWDFQYFELEKSVFRA